MAPALSEQNTPPEVAAELRAEQTLLALEAAAERDEMAYRYLTGSQRLLVHWRFMASFIYVHQRVAGYDRISRKEALRLLAQAGEGAD